MEESSNLLSRLSVLVRFIVVGLVVLILALVMMRLFQRRQENRRAEQAATSRVDKNEEADKNKQSEDSGDHKRAASADVPHGVAEGAADDETAQIPNTGTSYSALIIAGLLAVLAFGGMHLHQAHKQSSL